MDAWCFDDLTASIGTGTASRRRVLTRFAVAALGDALPRPGPTGADAFDHPGKGFCERRNKDEACRAGTCSPEHVCRGRHDQVRCLDPNLGIDTRRRRTDRDCCCGAGRVRDSVPGKTKPIAVCCPSADPACRRAA